MKNFLCGALVMAGVTMIVLGELLSGVLCLIVMFGLLMVD